MHQEYFYNYLRFESTEGIKTQVAKRTRKHIRHDTSIVGL